MSRCGCARPNSAGSTRTPKKEARDEPALSLISYEHQCSRVHCRRESLEWETTRSGAQHLGGAGPVHPWAAGLQPATYPTPAGTISNPLLERAVYDRLALAGCAAHAAWPRRVGERVCQFLFRDLWPHPAGGLGGYRTVPRLAQI